MPKIIAVGSFRRGIGKSTVVANLATLLALQGHRVGILDLDPQWPGVGTWFGLDEQSIDRALTDTLWSQMPLEATALALHECEDAQRPFLKPTQLWLTPACKNLREGARLARERYDISPIQPGIQRLVNRLALDYLILDTQAGLDLGEVMLYALSDTVLVLMTPDRQGLLGTGQIIELARRLHVPNIRLVLNPLPSTLDFAQVRQPVSTAYQVPVVGVLPYSMDVARTNSTNVFSALYPEHPWSQALQEIGADVTAVPLVPDG